MAYLGIDYEKRHEECTLLIEDVPFGLSLKEAHKLIRRALWENEIELSQVQRCYYVYMSSDGVPI